MKFTATSIEGVILMEQEKIQDERGFFARTYCRNEFAKQGINFQPIQESTSFNHKTGTLRGMHFQKIPSEEQKLVRATRGAIYDVALDLRKSSKTYFQSFGLELSAENGAALFLPKGIAHGFLTLKDNTEILYLIDTLYEPGLSSGVRWNDPAFAISWPAPPKIISAKDESWPPYEK